MSCVEIIPAKIRAIRLSKGLRQEELDACWPAAHNPTARIEHGDLLPPPGMLCAYARALGASAPHLCGWEGDGDRWDPSCPSGPMMARRRELGISRAALAEALGWHESWVRAREVEHYPTDLYEVEHLARALSCDPAWLMGWGGTTREPPHPGEPEPSPIPERRPTARRTASHLVDMVRPPTEPEEWRPIPGWPGYQVSDHGRIRNRKLRCMKQRMARDGYRDINLCAKGSKRTVSVHRLVCEAFHGAPPEGAQVDHINGIRSDNRAENLEWVTGEENNRRKGLR